MSKILKLNLAVLMLFLFVSPALAKTLDFYFDFPINSVVAYQVKMFLGKQIETLAPNIIRFYINSPGGTVSDSIALYDFLVSLRDRVTVETIATGGCYSGGTIVLQAGQIRSITPNCIFMVHKARIVIEPWYKEWYYNWRYRREILFTNKRLYELYAARTGLSKQVIEELLAIDRWLTAEEAIEWHLADRIVK